jgi:hypothetical protein
VAKRLALLHELVPKAVRIAVLINRATGPGTDSTLQGVREAARAIGLQIRILNATTIGEIDAAFATLAAYLGTARTGVRLETSERHRAADIGDDEAEWLGNRADHLDALVRDELGQVGVADFGAGVGDALIGATNRPRINPARTRIGSSTSPGCRI